MKEIKVTESIEKVVGYEAIDGTRFDDKEECYKYDKTAGAVIKAEFKKRIVKAMPTCNITKCGDIAFTEPGEEWGAALVRIKDKEDLRVCNMFSQFDRNTNQFNESMIGKDVIVYIGDWYGDQMRLNNCWVCGTIDDCVEEYRKGLMKFYEPEEKKGE